jgi:molybdopterin synthase catalytic subunit|tara:strand:+ start:3203 stop:3607 length:405 start_codon:yes stop_codon:yes gene_type:complete
MIKIQKNNFNIEKEINSIKSKHSNIGAVSTFIGYVRDINNNQNVTSINIEVYKEMALKTLGNICENAKKKWSLIDFLVIHRFGELQLNDKIVLVATFSIHRKKSYLSCNYIMDFLKKDAPFWKKEYYNEDYKWL